MEGIASTSKSTEYFGKNREDKETKPRETFSCSFCSLNEHFDYKGTKPPFAKHLIYLEECYIMRDPFSPLKLKETLVLGADCYFCKKPVCLDCSLFYTKRFCKTCALENIKEIPSQLHKKVKQLSMDENN